MLLSIITPTYNEDKNIPLLYKQISVFSEKNNLDFEWIVIDDCSNDNTFNAAKIIADYDSRVHLIKFSRNFGSHIAIRCGLSFCKGDYAIVMAADMQDPPDIILDLIAAAGEDYDIVWAVRTEREGEKQSTKAFSGIFYWILIHFLGIHNQPPKGSDYFCITRKVINTVNNFPEKNINILALLCWLGFKQKQINYIKKSRLHGKSGWTLKKKINLVIDSVTSFSFLPVRFLSFFGFLSAVSGFFYAIFVILNRIIGGNPIEGWSSLMVITLFIGGIILIMLGTLGEYLWRNLDESRKRPLYVIDKTINII